MTAWDCVRVIASREVRARLQDRTFLGSTVLLLVLVVAAVVVPVLLTQQVPTHRVAVQGQAAEAVVDLADRMGREAERGDVVPPVLELLQPAGLPGAHLEPVVLEPGGDPELLVRDGDVSAAVLGERLDGLRVVGREAVPGEVEVLVAAAAARLHVQQVAERSGLTAEQVRALTTPVPPVVQALEPRATGALPATTVTIAVALLFSAAVLLLGTAVAHSVAEEKQSRVVEILVAAMPVRLLLVGKVLGSSVTALGQVVVVVAAAVLAAFATGRGEMAGQLLGASGWLVVFFLLGFLTVAALWAAAGALTARVQDLDATTVVLQVLVVLPFFAAVLAVEPGSVQRLLSYVPFTAPLVMPARVVLGTAEPWEPWLAVLVVLATGAVLVALGDRVYRHAVLHTAARLRAVDAWRGVDA